MYTATLDPFASNGVSVKPVLTSYLPNLELTELINDRIYANSACRANTRHLRPFVINDHRNSLIHFN